MPFCPNCKSQIGKIDKFCRACGKELSQPSAPKIKEQTSSPAIESQPIPDTSRLSGLGIEKFLVPGEKMVYSTPNRIRYGNQKEYGYVTSKRALFYSQKGVLLGLIINQIKKFKLVETGIITKKLFLQLDEMKLEGSRGDLMDFYKAIQSVRDSI